VSTTTYRKLIATTLTPHFREAAEIVEEPIPEPGRGEVLVRNLYAGVNATDVNITAGRYSADPELPLDLGAEAAGEVVAVGEAVKNLEEGDAVVTGLLGGGYREYQIVSARHAIPVPEATPEALSVVVSGLTASIALGVTGDMGTDETVMVTAAAGGTGQYAVQLAKLAGNHVVGTCGTDAKVELLRDLGCDRPINYRTENVRKVLREEYPDGLNLVYEGVGSSLFDTCVDNLAVHGRLLSIGYVGEYVEGLERVEQPRIYAKLLGKSASVRGFFLPHFRRYFEEHTQRLFWLIGQDRLHVAIDPKEFIGVESIPDAVEYLHSGESRGKVVVQF
jgi:NADPH-dependent curcumin reductase CurA